MRLRDGSPAESETPTPYAVRCRGIDPEVGHGPCNSGDLIFLTEKCYKAQMSLPDSLWKCPRCGGDAWWDDENYEEYLELMHGNTAEPEQL